VLHQHVQAIIHTAYAANGDTIEYAQAIAAQTTGQKPTFGQCLTQTEKSDAQPTE
jgi:hypothetical protein